ncbi:hypothetical protein T11_11 [Trichinella zimbabwensis]|uniref:Uncharacterized protein n=1 Tax=Trichinella zimbabwensis TaxID=268475 RepID=A0A0V1H172_9BILA|nr:hypothetical protein T11_11 [Trichinella zimbabwensis]
MIRHRYGDRYLHNGALEIGFSDLFSYNNLKNKNHINHRLESSAKVSLQTTLKVFVEIVKSCAIFLCFAELKFPSFAVHFAENDESCLTTVSNFRINVFHLIDQ